MNLPTIQRATSARPTDSQGLDFDELTTALFASITYLAHSARHKFPGLEADLLERVELAVDADARDALGTFRRTAQHFSGRAYHRITIYAGHPEITRLPPARRAEALVATCAHELAHFQAHRAGTPDTSGKDGRTHTEIFGGNAEQLWLRLERRPRDPVGIRTPGLSKEGIEELGHLLRWLERRLPTIPPPVNTRVIAPLSLLRKIAEPQLDIHDSAYLFATCICRTESGERTFVRVARDYWPQVQSCTRCHHPYLAVTAPAHHSFSRADSPGRPTRNEQYGVAPSSNLRPPLP